MLPACALCQPPNKECYILPATCVYICMFITSLYICIYKNIYIVNMYIYANKYIYTYIYMAVSSLYRGIYIYVYSCTRGGIYTPICLADTFPIYYIVYIIYITDSIFVYILYKIIYIYIHIYMCNDSWF